MASPEMFTGYWIMARQALSISQDCVTEVIKVQFKIDGDAQT